MQGMIFQLIIVLSTLCASNPRFGCHQKRHVLKYTYLKAQTLTHTSFNGSGKLLHLGTE